MRNESAMARIGRWTLALTIVAVAALAPVSSVARAQDSPASITVGSQTMGPGVEDQRWWGVAGAALCGLEVRLILRAPAIGMNPYVLAAGVAGCTLAVLDIITSD